MKETGETCFMSYFPVPNPFILSPYQYLVASQPSSSTSINNNTNFNNMMMPQLYAQPSLNTLGFMNPLMSNTTPFPFEFQTNNNYAAIAAAVANANANVNVNNINGYPSCVQLLSNQIVSSSSSLPTTTTTTATVMPLLAQSMLNKLSEQQQQISSACRNGLKPETILASSIPIPSVNAVVDTNLFSMIPTTLSSSSSSNTTSPCTSVPSSPKRTNNVNINNHKNDSSNESDNDSEKPQKRKYAKQRRITQALPAHPFKTCISCHTAKTPLWRDANQCLCNACGIRLKKAKVQCVNCKYVPQYSESKFFKSCPKCDTSFSLSGVEEEATKFTPIPLVTETQTNNTMENSQVVTFNTSQSS